VPFSPDDLRLIAAFSAPVCALLSPLIALRVSRRLDARREVRERKMKIFRTLMANRARQLSIEHVEALNMIDVEFSEPKGPEKVVAVAWKEYLDLLNKPATTEGWGPRTDDLYFDLLYKMGVCLGYDFDKVHLKNQRYFPQGHGQTETDQRVTRELMLEILRGARPVPIRLFDPPVPPPTKL
jgi:hypothetical protein